MLTYTLGEKLGIKQPKKPKKPQGEICGCGRDIIKRTPEGASIYNVWDGTCIFGKLGRVPSCKQCYLDERIESERLQE